MSSPIKQDLSYINNDNWRVILDRINSVIKDADKNKTKPVDIVELLHIRHFIYEKFTFERTN